LLESDTLPKRAVTTEPHSPTNLPDDAALDHQVRAFLEGRPLIQAHIRMLVRDAALAEDVFQEVWVRFERVTRHGEIVANVPAWCRATARLVALEGWRKQRREPPTTDAELAALVEQAYEEQDSRADFWSDHSAALTQCLDVLPSRSRDLVTRRYHNGQPIAEMAAQLGQSLGSVKTALCRLRLALAECVRKRIELNPT
jgi:RNA polymerase sigma-70 factor (ECF subfamily)